MPVQLGVNVYLLYIRNLAKLIATRRFKNYTYLNTIFNLFIVMCTRLSVVTEIINYYTSAFLTLSHKPYPPDRPSQCKTYMPENKLIIDDF